MPAPIIDSTVDYMVGVLQAAGLTLAGGLLPVGMKLLLALATLRVCWDGIRMAFDQEGLNQFAANFVNTILVVGILIWILQPDVGVYANLVGYIDGGFDWISQALVDKVTNGMSGKGVVGSIGTLFIDGMKDLITTIFTLVSELSLTNIGNSLSNVVGVFFYLFCIFIATVAMCIALATYINAVLLFAIGVALGPILIPWFVWTPMKEAAEHWFGFVMAAAAQKMMVILILSFMVLLTKAPALKDAAAGVHEGSFSAVAGMMVMFMYVLIAYCVLQTPAIVNALLPGRPTLGLRGIMGAAKGAQGLAGGTASRAGQALQAAVRAPVIASRRATQGLASASQRIAALRAGGQSMGKAAAGAFTGGMASSGKAMAQRAGAAVARTAIGQKGVDAWARDPFTKPPAPTTPAKS
jgi:type IV secretory pathway TrbL component